MVNRIEKLTNVHIHDPATSHGHGLLPEASSAWCAERPGRKPYGSGNGDAGAETGTRGSGNGDAGSGNGDGERKRGRG